MSSGFVGHWRVTEYVYAPDGTFLGRVFQQRRLESLGDNRLRVWQQCEPEASLDGHVMAAFAGEWVFELARAGRQRTYCGPDVVGVGLGWGDQVLTTQGMWPRFGHNFTGYSVLVSQERQLTGGRFYRGAQMVAEIVGVAVPDENGRSNYPSLTGETELTGKWHGPRWAYATDGSLQQHDQAQWPPSLNGDAPQWRIERRSGWQTEWVSIQASQPNCETRGLQLLDNSSSTLVLLEIEHDLTKQQWVGLRLALLTPQP